MLDEGLREDLVTIVDADGDNDGDKIVISPLLRSLLIGHEKIHLWRNMYGFCVMKNWSN